MKLSNHNLAGGRARLFLTDRETGVKRLAHDWTHNLVFDSGLNLMAAGGTGFANLILFAQVGSGTNANEFNAGGSSIFTQAGTTITATSIFFTSAMIGAIFKYGTTGTSSGIEQYITAVAVGGLSCTVAGGGMTVALSAGAVWMVQQTALQTPLYASNTTTAGSTLQTGNTCTLTRTFSFNEAANYSVNEVGYSAAGGTSVAAGRIVLGSTVSVNSSDILSCELEYIWTVTPAAPVAVGNVGTNFNTAGQLMNQAWGAIVIDSAGNGSVQNSTMMDAPGSGNDQWTLLGSTLTLNSSIAATASLVLYPQLGPRITIGAFSNASQPVGVGVWNGSYSVTTAGQTCYGFVFGGIAAGAQTYGGLILLLTTPVTLPTGTFAGTIQLSIQFSRTLVN